MHEAMMTMRLMEMVVKSVCRREGASSTERPRVEAKRITARLIVMPL